MSLVKICGLMRKEDALAANSCLPDYVGFVFAKSRRQINAEKARELKEYLNVDIKTVGVFVNDSIEFIVKLCNEGIINCIQLHGDETGAYIEKLSSKTGNIIIKSVSIENSLPLLPQSADYLLFDTAAASRGGSGNIFNWSLLKDYTDKPYFLAGGLNAQNINNAINLLNPFCVDVSSGVETDGLKDINKMIEFVSIVRNR